MIGLIAYLSFAPVPAVPVGWDAPKPPGYVGVHVPNTRLANLRTLSLGEDIGPEHVRAGPDGRLYVSVHSGRILRLSPAGGEPEVFATTGGRVLGFDLDGRGNLIAAEASRGLIAIGPDGKVTALADKVDDDQIRYPNSVVVARDGRVYFTDSTRRFAPRDWGGTFEASLLDIIEQSATGRVLLYDPALRTVTTIARGLSFANGIAMSADETRLFVAETGRYRVWQIAAGARNLDVSKGTAPGAAILLDNLPGYPDNLLRGLPAADGTGRIWLGLVKPRSGLVDAMSKPAFLRKVTLRLPRVLWPVPKPYGHVIAFAEDGRILEDLQDPSGAYPETTGVMETRDRLYIMSLTAGRLGWMARP
jgi:sugar lactone lactonase YvrE